MREEVTLTSERDPYTGDPAVSCVVTVEAPAQASQHADKRLWKAQQFMVKNPHCTKTGLADHLRGRRTQTLDEIDQWVLRGELRFQRRRQMSALASLKAEQMVVTAAVA
jgi:hypothetical protein